MFLPLCQELIYLSVLASILLPNHPMHVIHHWSIYQPIHLYFYQCFLVSFPPFINTQLLHIKLLTIPKSNPYHQLPLCTFMATVSFTSTDLSCPLSSKKTSLWPALFRSPSASALMWRIFPLSSSTWTNKKKTKPDSRGRAEIAGRDRRGKGMRAWRRKGHKLD